MKNKLLLMCLLLLNVFFVQAQVNETEPNNSIAEANPLPLGTTMNGQSCLFTDPDYFRIILPVDGVLKIKSNVSTPVNNPPQKFSITLTSKTNNSFSSFFSAVGGNGSALPDSIEYCCLEADTFYLVVYRSWATELCYDYSFTCTLTPSTFANDAEPNNYPLNPLPLAYNTNTDGHLGFRTEPSFSSDVDDYYTIVTPSDGVVRVITQTEAQSMGNSTMNVTLYNKSNSELYTQYATAGAFKAPHTDTLYWDCLSKDTLHIKTSITNVGDAGYAYRMHYNVIAPVFANDKEPNNSYAEAQVINPDNPIEGHMYYYGATDEDYYKFFKSDTGFLKIYAQAETWGSNSNIYYVLRLESKNHGTIATHYPLIGGHSQSVFDSIIVPSLPADSFYVIIQQSLFGAPCMSYHLQILTSHATGFAEAGSSHFNLSPNPSDGDFFIEADRNIPDAFLQVYDIFGKRVYGEKLHLDTRVKIHLANCSPGVYIVEMDDGQNKYLRKMIIQ